MHAVIAGHGRRPMRHGRHNRFIWQSINIYTGSSSESCNWCRSLSILSFGLSGVSALSGIMLAVFGSTDFFRTNELNSSLIIVGIVLLIMALVLIALGFAFSRRVPQQNLQLSPRIPNLDQDNFN